MSRQMILETRLVRAIEIEGDARGVRIHYTFADGGQAYPRPVEIRLSAAQAKELAAHMVELAQRDPAEEAAKQAMYQMRDVG